MNARLFNETYDIGSKFEYQPIKGINKKETVTTRSYAWQLAHGDTVVKVTGRSGGVDVEHLTPIK
jgi:hypothetical protein